MILIFSKRLRQIRETLTFWTEFDEKEYHLDAWVVMPNHFHALVTPKAGNTLGGIVQRWKSGSTPSAKGK